MPKSFEFIHVKQSYKTKNQGNYQTINKTSIKSQ